MLFIDLHKRFDAGEMQSQACRPALGRYHKPMDASAFSNA